MCVTFVSINRVTALSDRRKHGQWYPFIYQSIGRVTIIHSQMTFGMILNPEQNSDQPKTALSHVNSQASSSPDRKFRENLRMATLN
jgi:hypothetical protein